MVFNLKRRYYQFFAIQEIESSPVLQLLFYALSLSFFITFFGWVEKNFISISTYQNGLHVCPPYFPSCGEYLFLESLPYGYSQSAFYLLLFLALSYGVYAAYRKDWTSAHVVILSCLIWKVIVGFFFTYGLTGNFDYYDMALAFVWLFMREKEYFAKITFVFLYVLASSIKIDGGWIFANYFNSLFTGAPLFNHAILPFFTNIVIVMQMVGSWFLLSNRRLLQTAALTYFLLFHIYSGIIVNYRYIAISIPALFILFSQQGHFHIKRITRNTLLGYLFLLFLLAGQLTGILIPGDQKKTLEGNYYGMYMFEANHQCFSKATVYSTGNTEPIVLARENHVANNRCDPYRYWFPLKTKCMRDDSVARISWTFDHSINGEKYERIVDVEDVCVLEYRPFAHNEWIRTDNAQVLDTPIFKNGFAYDISPQIKVSPDLIKNEKLLENLVSGYWLLWILSILGACSAVLYATFKRQ
ncbi:MAG: hypothetical protein AAB421_00295 [Patescibacteria group bacterium]